MNPRDFLQKDIKKYARDNNINPELNLDLDTEQYPNSTNRSNKKEIQTLDPI